MKKISMLSLAGATLLSFAAIADVMPLSNKLPEIDGKIGEEEYSEAITIGPLSRLHPLLPWHMLEGESDGTVSFLTDGDKLCVAWRVKAWTVDFDGSLRSGVTRRDGPIRYNDDAVELEVGATANGKRAHFAVNRNCIVYDAMIGEDGTSDAKWNCNEVQVKSSLAHGWWLVEMSLPLSAVGANANAFYVNAGRSGPRCSYISLAGYEAPGRGKMIKLSAHQGAPAVKFIAPGNPTGGDWSTELACGKVPDGKKVVATSLIREILGDNSNIAIASELSKEFTAAGEFCATFKTNSSAWFRAEISFADAQTGETLMKRDYVTRRVRKSNPIPVTARAELGELGTISVRDYPGYGKARITVETKPDSAVEAVRGIFNGAKFELKKIGGEFTSLVDSPKSEGEHSLGVALNTASGIKKFPNVLKIVRRRNEWEGNSIGRERIIVPPFTAIKDNGGELDVLLRKCRFAAAALPSSIKASERELMAEPAYFEMTVDGKTHILKGKDAKFAVAADGIDATVDSSASAAGVTISAKGKFEYDGFSFCDYSLSGVSGRTVSKLTLKIPLVDKEVPLMHVCVSDSIRSNPTGKVPDGEGVVWDSSVLGRKTGGRKLMYAAQSVPYLWLGAEKRGLSWFMNNTCGLRLDPAKGSVRFVRKNGKLCVEIDFINLESALEDEHSFAFGFQATPVKTQDRQLMRHFQTSMGGFPENFIPRFCVGREIGGFWSGWARRPYGGDWNLFALAGKVAAGESLQKEFMAACKENDLKHDAALEKYCENKPKIGSTPHFQWVRGCRGAERSFLVKGLKGNKSYPYKYSDPTLNWEGEAEVAEYGAEWISRTCGYTGATRNFLTPSYLDYILFYYKKEIELGMKGLYFDDMFPMTCRNPDTAAKLDSDGSWHGNFGILEMRELVKRAAVMQHLAGVSPRLIQIHMTNCLLVPSFAFGTSLLSWEDHYGEDVFQKRFKLDYLRAESLGSQLGAESVALDGIKRKTSKNNAEWMEKFKFLTRTQQALLLPAGVKTWQRSPWPPNTGVEEKELYKILGVLGKFGIWEDGCEFVPFYDDDGAIGGQPATVLLGSYRKAGKVLAIFGNLSGEAVQFKLSFDRRKLKLSNALAPINAETGEELAGGIVKLAPYDVILVRIETSRTEVLAKWDFSGDSGKTWQRVEVPHDAAIAGPFDQRHDMQKVKILENGEETESIKTGRTGALPWLGKVEYRRKVSIPEGAGYAALFFDGVMGESEVFVDGKLSGGWKCGYNAFVVELPSKAGEYEVCVKAVNRPESSRWYPGAGMYRRVKLVLGQRTGLELWGNAVYSPDLKTVKVVSSFRGRPSKVVYRMLDNGTEIARSEDGILTGNFEAWSPENPKLYTLVTQLYDESGDVLESAREAIGVRTLEYGKDGFKLNGKKRKFKGVCLHHDLGPLGAAFYGDAFRRQLTLLKEMGCDSIRTAHNMPGEEQLEICDEMGFMVMAESFDSWAQAKCKNGYNLFFDEWWKRDLENLVKKCRNRPSVVMWSIGNEIGEQVDKRGLELSVQLQEWCHKFDPDPQRKVTQGLSWMPQAIESGVTAAMEVPAVTYRLPFYKAMYEASPHGFVLGAETASTLSSRGEYFFPPEVSAVPFHENLQCSSYDLEFCSWSNLPDDDWAVQDDNPWTIGEFVWTGFDYLGEPTPYDHHWPSRSSYFGIFDLAGLAKDRYWLYRSRWNEKEHTCHILPHWTWPGREGKITPVYCYTDGVEAELFVNGKSQGRRRKDPSSRLDRYRLRWNDVVYEPGEIKIVAYDKQGKEIGKSIVRTAGKAAKVKLDKRRFGKLLFVEATVVDKDGNHVPTFNKTLKVEAVAPLRFKAICNGDATSLESFVLPQMKAFNGKLVAVFEGDGEDVKISF